MNIFEVTISGVVYGLKKETTKEGKTVLNGRLNTTSGGKNRITDNHSVFKSSFTLWNETEIEKFMSSVTTDSVVLLTGSMKLDIYRVSNKDGSKKDHYNNIITVRNWQVVGKVESDNRVTELEAEIEALKKQLANQNQQPMQHSQNVMHQPVQNNFVPQNQMGYMGYETQQPYNPAYQPMMQQYQGYQGYAMPQQGHHAPNDAYYQQAHPQAQGFGYANPTQPMNHQEYPNQQVGTPQKQNHFDKNSPTLEGQNVFQNTEQNMMDQFS